MIKDYFRTNLGIKIACLCLAYFFWYALKNEETMEKTVRVYVSPKISDNMYLINVQPASVEVTLTGSRRTIKDMGNFPYSIEIDLSKETEAKIFQNYLKESDFSFPQQVKITKIDPDKVDIELDRLDSQYVPVEVVTEGRVASNYELDQINLIPSRIKVTGPEKILKKTTLLKTDKVNIENMNTNFIQEVQIVPPFPGFKANQSVKAFITINKSKEEKVFDNIPVRIMQSSGASTKCTIKPSEVSLKISASTVDFQGASKDDFTAYVDINGLGNGSYELPVIIVKKDLFKLIEVNPKSVEVTVGDRS